MNITLQDYKLDDLDIFNDQGVRLASPLEHIEIKQLSCADWFFKYIPFLQRCVNHLNAVIKYTDFFAEHTPENIKEFKKILAFAMTNINFIRDCIRFFISAGILKGSIDKCMRELPIDGIVKIFIYTYLFNTDGLKKKLFFLAQEVGIKKNMTLETSSTNASVTAGSGIVAAIKAKRSLLSRR